MGSALFVVGEAGLGKTAVLERAGEATAAGIETASGRGEAMEASIPFGLAAELIGSLPGDPPKLLAPDEAPVEPSAPYYRVLRWLRERQGKPLGLIIDDLHWADADSLALIGFLARRLRNLPVALVATLRPWPPATIGLARELGGAGHAEILPLAPLTRPSADSMLATVTSGRVSKVAKQRAWELARGNPLLVEQVGAALDRGEQLPAASESTPGIAEGLLLTRFAGLDADGLVCVRAASVLGTRFRPDLAAQGAKLEGQRADHALEALTRTGLVEPTEGTMLRFAHPLLAQALYDDIAAPVRRSMHERFFALLSARGLGAEASEHAVRADLEGDERAIAVLEQAGRAALAAGAVAGAVRWLEAAVRFSGDRPRPDLLLGLAQALTATGRMEDTIPVCRRALDDPDLRWPHRTEAQRMLGRAMYLTGAPDHGERAFEDAVSTAVAHEPVRAVRALLDQSLSAWLAGGPARALPVAARARQIAAGGDDALRERALATWGHIALESGDPEGLAATEPVGARLEDPHAGVVPPDDLIWPWGLVNQFAQNAFEVERFDDAERAFELVRSKAESAGAANALATQCIFIATVAIRRGLLAKALREAERAIEFSELTPGVQHYASLVRAEALLWLGRAPDSEAACRAAEAGAGEQWFARMWLAHVRGLRLLWQGDAAASDQLLEVERITNEVGIREPCVRHWGTHAVAAHIAAERFDDATRVVAWLEECAQPLPCRWPRFATALGRARLAEAGDETDEAATAFEEAVAFLDGVDLPLQRVEALLAYGGFLRRAGAPAEARSHLKEALQLAEISDAGSLAKTARSELRLAGGRRRRFDADRDRLTPAERRVADQAAAGLTNAEIARQLHLSVNTVETHLKRVYSKVGIHSRRQLMRLDLDEIDQHPVEAVP